MNKENFYKYLDHPYINTGHSQQGKTIRKKYIIFDWKYSYVSINWLWVCLSRCDNIKNVWFYDAEDNKKPFICNVQGYKI